MKIIIKMIVVETKRGFYVGYFCPANQQFMKKSVAFQTREEAEEFLKNKLDAL